MPVTNQKYGKAALLLLHRNTLAKRKGLLVEKVSQVDCGRSKERIPSFRNICIKLSYEEIRNIASKHT